MMRRRMVGRSLVRVAATTAVVAGTAGAVRHHQDQKYAQKDYEQQAAAQGQYNDAQQQAQMDQMMQQQAMQQQQLQQMQQAQSAPPPAAAAAPAAPASAAPDMMAQLQQLAQLHTAGVLTDEEFAAAKQKLLAS